MIIQFKLNKYSKYYPLGFFISGFLFDIITLGEIDDISNILSQFIFIAICALLLKLEHSDTKIIYANRLILLVEKYQIEIFHFCLGSLLNTYMLFYLKSSSFASSFIFLLILSTLIIMNELDFFKQIGIKLRIVLFSICLYSFYIAQIPIVVGSANYLTFLISTILTLLSFKLIIGQKFKVAQISIPHIVTILSILFLYFFKMLPPLPLAIKSIYVLKKIEKHSGGYLAETEKAWWRFWHNGDQLFNYRAGDKVYIFASIFAPGGFSGIVYMKWQKFIEKDYLTSDRIPFTLTGGRQEGFRGYSFKQAISPGIWRVIIENETGHEIGRISFVVIKSEKEKDILKNSFEL
jgi:hypothetical protein